MAPEAMLGTLREVTIIILMIAPIVGSGLLVGLAVSVFRHY